LVHNQKQFTFAVPGELAHLVERLHGMQKVTGSIPVFSTLASTQVLAFFMMNMPAYIESYQPEIQIKKVDNIFVQNILKLR
jgi:hypothetical protein